MKHKLSWIGIFLGTFLFWVFPFQNELTAQEAVSIEEMVFCEDVVDRTPVNPGTEFEAGVEKVYCFTAVANPGPKTTITHVWSHEGEEKTRVEMNVGTSSRWRTWSKFQPEWTGSWNVTVLDAAGTEIGSADFNFGPLEAAPEPEAEPEETVTEEEMGVPEEPEEVPEAPETEEEVPDLGTEEEVAPPEAAPEDTVAQDTSGLK
ncbi:MAG: DUF2914 domain-containing protein [Candidatus Neomarinimicrobiota bacterium]